MPIRFQLKEIKQLTKELNEQAKIVNKLFCDIDTKKGCENNINVNTPNLNFFTTRLDVLTSVVEEYERRINDYSLAISENGILKLAETFKIQKAIDTLTLIKNQLTTDYIDKDQKRVDYISSFLDETREKLEAFPQDLEYQYRKASRHYRVLLRDLNERTGLNLPIPSGLTAVKEYSYEDIVKKMDNTNKQEEQEEQENKIPETESGEEE